MAAERSQVSASSETADRPPLDQLHICLHLANVSTGFPSRTRVHPSDTHSQAAPPPARAKEMDDPADAGAVPSSTSSSRSSADEDDAFQDQLGGHGVALSLAPPAAADVGSPVQRRRFWPWATARAAAPWLREECENPARDLVAWTRRGGAPRCLLVVSVGSVALVVLSGLVIVVFFVVAAATNAIAVSVVVSMVAAGGCLAVLLAFLTAIYIGALTVAVFVISVTTIATAIAITIATGWVAFFWFVWFTGRECLSLATKPRTGTINP